MQNNMSHFSLKSLFGAVFLFFAFSFGLKAQDGAKLFKQNCAVCHTLTDQKLTGPGLAGVFDRAPKGSWLHDWILDNQKMIKSGDAYANKIYSENNKAQMTVFAGQLSDPDVDAILAYMKNPPAPKTDVADGPKVGGGETEEVKGGIDPLYLLLGGIVILAIVLGALRSVRHSLQNSYNRKEGKPENPDVTFGEEVKQWISGHRRLVGVFVILIAFGGMKSCWDACFDLGVYYEWETQKGYHPDQPIKFSHKLHAGDNEIACQYCHNSVEKSKHAGIPTVNVCMNCHKGIQSGPEFKEKEISKIYAAAGFNPKTGVYDAPQNPIKWIKVHTLPDHVFFSHQQHVVVGKQECASCHGDVKKMTTIEQKSPLTMKWCIECHRKTEVAMEGNPYYDRLHKALKEKYKGQYDVKFTVDKIGGLECAKCHY
jgi:mono/diheme cytochrome c family protein